MSRDTKLAEGDSRRKYPMYQGEEWERNQAFLDAIRQVAEESGRTVAQIVVHWTIRQPGITAALCGAKRPWQIEETAAAMDFELAEEHMVAIDRAIAQRGKAEAKRLFR